MLKTFIAAAFCGALALAPVSGDAMTFRQDTLPGGLLLLHFDGKIEHGDFERLVVFYKLLVAAHPGATAVVSLNSPGGYVVEAMRMAIFLRELKQSTTVGPFNKCTSACFMLFAAGKNRYVGPGAQIGVHRAGEEGDAVGDVVSEALTLKMSQLLAEYGVPPYILGRLVRTDFRSVYMLTTADLRSMQAIVFDSKVATAPAPAPTRPAVRANPSRPDTTILRGSQNTPYGFSR